MSDKYVSAELRRLVEKRASGCCEYCFSQSKYSADSFTIDHIIPYSISGSNEVNNLAFACRGCNQHKSVRTSAEDPLTGSIERLFNPRQNNWNAHFTWSEDFTKILSITATGRATIEGLQLNRPGLVNLRRVLYSIGEHPPQIITEQ